MRAGLAVALMALLSALIPPRAGAAKPAPAPPVPVVERNVVYGMFSGAALLLDVHRPAKSNGLGVIFVSGSGWQASTDYGATPLKEQQIGLWGPPPEDAAPVVVVWQGDSVDFFFSGCTPYGRVTGPVDNEETERTTVYVCDALIGSWAAAWPQLVHLSA